MPTGKIAREWRDLYANELARAVYQGRKPDDHSLSAWSQYDAESRSGKPFNTPPVPTHHEGTHNDPRPRRERGRSQPELQGSAWKDITTAIRDGALSVVVPKIVAAEITGTVQKNRRDQRPKGDVHRAPEAVQQSVQDAADEVERWAESYDATIYLEAEGVTIRDTPTVTHDEVAQRAIDRGRPFNEKGGGYRDALHWYTVLDIAREHPDEDLVFVSQDAAYQNSSRDDLHADLRAEMEAVLTTGTITLCTTLKEFVPPQKYAGDEDRVFPKRSTSASSSLHCSPTASCTPRNSGSPSIWGTRSMPM